MRRKICNVVVVVRNNFLPSGVTKQESSKERFTKHKGFNNNLIQSSTYSSRTIAELYSTEDEGRG